MAAEFLLDFEPVALAHRHRWPDPVRRPANRPSRASYSSSPMQKSTRLLALLVLLQLLPALKATGLALARTSWPVATCLFWGPWLLLLVLALLGLLLRKGLQPRSIPASSLVKLP